jgi:low affinity Fe/Cu permease
MAARVSGSSAAFLIATTFIIVWAATGPAFGYSDTWQLVINTATTIITFLMVFLIQNTQNRDTMALQVKLAELIIAMKGAENRFAAVENLSDEELEQLQKDLAARAQATGDFLTIRRGKNRAR